MVTIESLLAVLGFAVTVFGLGYTIGSDKSQKK